MGASQWEILLLYDVPIVAPSRMLQQQLISIDLYSKQKSCQKTYL